MKPLAINNGTMCFGLHKSIQKRSFKFKDLVLRFPKRQKKTSWKFHWEMVGLYRVQICLLNNIVLLIIMDKLNPYQFLDDEAQNARGLTHVY
jgi:hypothetical protein